MRLLSIALLSLFLFFPLYIVLHPLVGPNWGAGIAAGMMYLGFPAFFLLVFRKEWTGPVVKFFNYLIALLVLLVSVWFLYEAFISGNDRINAQRFFWAYGAAALYYFAFGRFHIDLKNKYVA